MSYTPTLIIRKSDLEKHRSLLLDEQYSQDGDTSDVSEFLLKELDSEFIKFDDIELIICSCEFSAFNNLVRIKLTELNIEFKTHN